VLEWYFFKHMLQLGGKWPPGVSQNGFCAT